LAVNHVELLSIIQTWPFAKVSSPLLSPSNPLSVSCQRYPFQEEALAAVALQKAASQHAMTIDKAGMKRRGPFFSPVYTSLVYSTRKNCGKTPTEKMLMSHAA